MLVKTETLSGPACDWAATQAVRAGLRNKYGEPTFDPATKRVYETEGLRQIGVNHAPSSDWAQGGPIIERERISVGYERYGSTGGGQWDAVMEYKKAYLMEYGPTPLIAAMRCFVRSRLGGSVEIPEKLL